MITDETVSELLQELARAGGQDECQRILKTALERTFRRGQEDVFTRGSMSVAGGRQPGWTERR